MQTLANVGPAQQQFQVSVWCVVLEFYLQTCKRKARVSGLHSLASSFVILEGLF